MNHFEYRRGHLHAEDVPLSAIAQQVGTPAYVYSTATICRHVRVMKEAFGSTPHHICYSVKANSSLAILALLHREGCGFDIVSGGELERVRKAARSLKRVVFSGVAKTEAEMAAGLKAGILLFNVESEEELWTLERVASQMGLRAPFAIRVNPDVDAKTHKYIATGLRTSKFGVPFEEAVALYRRASRKKALWARGLDCHIGSQLTEGGPFRAALEKVAGLYRELRGRKVPLELLDVGGGLGIPYRGETPPSPAEYARIIAEATAGTGATIVLEPGRVVVGNAGVLLTRVLFRKRTPHKTFVMVDAGMNDLLRPALYEAHHELRAVRPRKGKEELVDVVGPVCESSDVLAKERRLVVPKVDDLYAVMSAGAYGMSMASTYNSRPRPAEVLVDGDAFRVIREREAVSDLWRGERT